MGPGIKPPQERGVDDVVSDRYVKPLQDRPSLEEETLDEKQIPTIDLAAIEGGRRDRIVAEIAHACEDWGFFHIINHGVPLELIDKLKENANKFFRLPYEEKKLYAVEPGKRTIGYGAGNRTDVSEVDVLDWRESMSHKCRPLAERYNAEWPTNPEGCSETISEYADRLREVAVKLLEVISESLGLPSSFLEEFCGGEKATQLVMMNFYPSCPSPTMTLGFNSHSDIGTITLLLQDEVGGLQIRKDGCWLKVSPVPGAFTVNLGDQTQVITNGKYKSVEHRVVVNASKPRLSVATFYNPSPETTIRPAELFVNREHPAAYRSYSFGDYLAFCYAKGPSSKDHLQYVAINN
ncbi:hypothetical protein O6H91_05G113800 [Diphasiastrum complanatum]|uniref:Uncharacterized protein n=1 Tax=Diphasiastrum complanatum TaxID=34168 RepID=A0ACC2DSG8_DIPCM|nr:hypothetical protein O6H91_05G113800 [Diphasiastrum complanatum]